MLTKNWTVVDEYNERLGAIMEQYHEDCMAADAKEDKALEELDTWFKENYDGEHDVPWPKKEV